MAAIECSLSLILRMSDTYMYIITVLYYYTVLYYTRLDYTRLDYTRLDYTRLYYTILYQIHAILYYTILYYTMQCYTILYYSILFYSILICMVCTIIKPSSMYIYAWYTMITDQIFSLLFSFSSLFGCLSLGCLANEACCSCQGHFRRLLSDCFPGRESHSWWICLNRSGVIAVQVDAVAMASKMRLCQLVLAQPLNQHQCAQQ